MSHLHAHLQLFCFFLVSNVPTRQFVPDGPPAHSNPIIQKGTAFFYNYPAITSEIESKVRVFSPFPQPPPVDLTAVGSSIDLVTNIHNNFFCPFYKQLRLTSFSQLLWKPPRTEPMTSEKVLIIVSTCLHMNILSLHKITPNYCIFFRASPKGAAVFWHTSSSTTTTCPRIHGRLRCRWSCFRKIDTKCWLQSTFHL